MEDRDRKNAASDSVEGMTTRLREAVGDDDEFIAELMATFVDTTKQGVTVLTDFSVGGSSREDLRREAHALKGACLNVGADVIAAVCGTLEKNAPTADGTELHALIHEIADRLETLWRSIADCLADRAA